MNHPVYHVGSQIDSVGGSRKSSLIAPVVSQNSDGAWGVEEERVARR